MKKLYDQIRKNLSLIFNSPIIISKIKNTKLYRITVTITYEYPWLLAKTTSYSVVDRLAGDSRKILFVVSVKAKKKGKRQWTRKQSVCLLG